tara:strand:- start:2393 stop:3652 length:1260 start_codon:yes stop_codon:yes gene_type:complete
MHYFQIKKSSLMADLEEPSTTTARFLNAGERELLGGAVVLASYPRSGNSLFRDVCERITGVVTGSDVRPDRALSRALTRAGLRGEGTIDDKVLLVKTHYPERLGYAPLSARRIVLLVRNPLDSLVSYFNMMCTMSHTTSIEESEYERFRAEWDGFVAEEIEMWHRFNSWWMDRADSLGIPLVIIRYEDIVRSRRATADALINFLLPNDVDAVDTKAAAAADVDVEEAAAASGSGEVAPLPPIAGLGDDAAVRRRWLRSCWKARAAHLYVSEEEGTQIGAYRPRTGVVRIGASRDKYTKAQLAAMRANLPLRVQLDHFGYAGAIAETTAAMAAAEPLATSAVSAPPRLLTSASSRVTFNDGAGFRPRTQADPHARGFPWKKRVIKEIRTVRSAASASATAPPPPAASAPAAPRRASLQTL